MKKISLYAMLAGAALFAACDDSFNDWSAPQTNPQENPIEAPSVTTTANTDVIDLESAGTTVRLFSVASGAAEGYTLKNLKFVPVVEEAEQLELAITAIDAEGNFNTADVADLVRSIYGKKRAERNITGNVYLNFVPDGTTEAILANAGTVAVKVIPVDPGYENFYLVGTPNGWNNNTKGTYMIPSEKGVYSFTTSYNGAWDVKFIAEDNLGSWDELWGGIDGDNSPSGSLFLENSGAISSPEAGFYTFTADMNNSTYTWTKLDNQSPAEYATMGVIGGFNGWGGDVVMEQAAPHFWYVEYTLDAESELKFRANGGWDVNWGTGLTVSDSEFYGVATNGGDNIKVPAGTYAFYLNDITGEFAIVAQ